MFVEGRGRVLRNHTRVVYRATPYDSREVSRMPDERPSRSIPVSVRLPDDLLAALDAEAAAEDRTRTSVITAAVRAYLASRSTQRAA